MSVIYNTQTCSIKNNRVHLGEHTPVLLGEHTPPCNLLILLDLPGFLSNDLKSPQGGVFTPNGGACGPRPPGAAPPPLAAYGLGRLPGTAYMQGSASPRGARSGGEEVR